MPHMASLLGIRRIIFVLVLILALIVSVVSGILVQIIIGDLVITVVSAATLFSVIYLGAIRIMTRAGRK